MSAAITESCNVRRAKLGRFVRWLVVCSWFCTMDDGCAAIEKFHDQGQTAMTSQIDQGVRT